MSKNELRLNTREKILNFQEALVNSAVGRLSTAMFFEGAIHKHLHVWFLLTGNISVATEEDIEEYVAPCYVVATPGTKRVIYANEPSIFVNIHKNPSNTQNIEQLEKDIVAKDFKEYEEYINKNK